MLLKRRFCNEMPFNTMKSWYIPIGYCYNAAYLPFLIRALFSLWTILKGIIPMKKVMSQLLISCGSTREWHYLPKIIEKRSVAFEAFVATIPLLLEISVKLPTLRQRHYCSLILRWSAKCSLEPSM